MYCIHNSTDCQLLFLLLIHSATQCNQSIKITERESLLFATARRDSSFAVGGDLFTRLFAAQKKATFNDRMTFQLFA